MKPVTGPDGDNPITDAQIRQVRDAATRERDATLLGTALNALRTPGWYFQNGPAYDAARKRCAAAWNARHGGGR